MITTVMFDLDGTLLPFEQEDFVRIYFSELCRKLAPFGYEPDHTVKAIWAGTKAMIENDGGCENSVRFWETFRALNVGRIDAKRKCDVFYLHEFDRTKVVLKYIPDHKPTIERLKAAGLRVVLATNPIFPLNGVKTRLAWVGLSADDFELVTHYDNSTYCKPNPEYYGEILWKLGEKPENCLMVGNSIPEDMQAAAKAGLNVFLVPEFMENPDGADCSIYNQGTVEQAVDLVIGG